jgi:uncharacterized RmlC-like cupin family protein
MPADQPRFDDINRRAIKHVGDMTVEMGPGDVIFVPRNVYHGLENGSATEPVLTVWGYQGAANLADAGYFLPADDGIVSAPGTA